MSSEVLLTKEPLVTMEVFYFQRLTRLAEKYGFVDGGAYELTTGWDASQSGDVERLLRDIDEKDPYVVSCFPPCGYMSPLQALTSEEKRRDPARFESELKKEISFIVLCLEIARRQVRRGKHFIFEQSRGRATWDLNEMIDFLLEFEPCVAEAAGSASTNDTLSPGSPSGRYGAS